jgi:DNA repair exonuclease SbcCD ATPase subunit
LEIDKQERIVRTDQTDSASQLDYSVQRYQADQQTIAKLQQRTEAQAYELQEQARRIQKLEEQLAESQLKQTSTPQLDDQLLNLKSEILQIVEDQYTRRQQNFRDVNNAMLAQLDGFARSLYELRRDFDKTQRHDEQISLARAEMERLNKEVSKFETRFDHLSKQLEERARAATYLEDQRRADTLRLTELQAEMPNLHKKIESSLTKVQLVEQQIPQFGQYQAALNEVREDIRRHRENMDFQMAQRERVMKNWSDAAESIERRMDEYKGLMEKYAEHYQLNRRALESLQDFQERLQREQHKAAELQRLAEDRQQVEMEKWRAEYEQRWKKQSMEWKPNFADLQKNMDALQKRVDEMVKLSQTVKNQMELILQIIEEDIQNRTLTAQDWQQRFEELANKQV